MLCMYSRHQLSASKLLLTMEATTLTTMNHYGKRNIDAAMSRVDLGQIPSDRLFSLENLVLIQASHISGSLEDDLYDVGNVCG